MNRKQVGEVALVKALLATTGEVATNIRASDRPDVLLDVGGRTVGVEVTELHPDEGPRGSQLRAAEEASARSASGAPFWGQSDPMPALRARFEEKARRAAEYSKPVGSELWLLVASQVPATGRVASTFVVEGFVQENDLAALEATMNASAFDRAYILLCLDGAAFRWSRGAGWSLSGTEKHAAAKRVNRAPATPHLFPGMARVA
jgi:hypothetical protein